MHSLRPDSAIDMSRRMMAFNWLPAAYAHNDWLGSWADVLNPRDGSSLRTIQRASLWLLDHYDLRSRYLQDAGQFGWLLQPHHLISVMAQTLGTAMLGGWVKNRLERTEIVLQHFVLGAAGRQEALRYALELKALPTFKKEVFWSSPPEEPQALLNLGLSCMAALLQDVATGARERFTLRFSHGCIKPLSLTNAQAVEALALIERVSSSAGASR
jgi:hypothetical protein